MCADSHHIQILCFLTLLIGALGWVTNYFIGIDRVKVVVFVGDETNHKMRRGFWPCLLSGLIAKGRPSAKVPEGKEDDLPRIAGDAEDLGEQQDRGEG